MTPPNWVKARADCNLELSFQALREVAERDVSIANGIDSITRNRFAFFLQNEEGSHIPTFCVDRREGNRPVDKVLFKMYPQEITVHNSQGAKFCVTAVWDERNCRCNLLIDDDSYEIWQISRKALEPIFFFPG